MQPFRSDIDALEARHAALTAEVAAKQRARDEAAQMLAEARARERNEAYLADLATGGPARRRRYVALGFVGTFVVGLGILAVILLVHEGRKSRERRQAEIVAQFQIFTEQTCACTDAACTKQVSEAMSAWAMKLAAKADAEQRPDAKWMERMQQLGERMGKCMAKTLTEEHGAQVELER